MNNINSIETLLQDKVVEIPPQLRDSYLGYGYGWAEFGLDGRMRDFAYADYFNERLPCNQDNDIDEDESPCAGSVSDKGGSCQIFGYFICGEHDQKHIDGPCFSTADYRGTSVEMKEILTLFRWRNSHIGWRTEETIKTRLVEHLQYAFGTYDGALQKFCVEALAVYNRHRVCPHIYWNSWNDEMHYKRKTKVRPKGFKKMCKRSFIRLHERARQKRDSAAELFYRDMLLVYEKHGINSDVAWNRGRKRRARIC